MYDDDDDYDEDDDYYEDEESDDYLWDMLCTFIGCCQAHSISSETLIAEKDRIPELQDIAEVYLVNFHFGPVPERLKNILEDHDFVKIESPINEDGVPVVTMHVWTNPHRVEDEDD